MQRDCLSCGQTFVIAPEDLEFYKKVSPKIGGRIYDIPPPTHCPDCRKQRRLAFFNERSLYNGHCDLCDKKTVSIHTSDQKYPIFCMECWQGDKWEALDQGRDLDFGLPFFPQYAELMRTIPFPALHNISVENCDYTNYTGWSKDCYLIFTTIGCQNCAYARGLVNCRDCHDLYFGNDNELCYECFYCEKSYHLLYSENCLSCHHSAFLSNCVGCEHCFCCTNLTHKQYCISNQQYSKEEYEAVMRKVDFSYPSVQKLQERFKNVVAASVHRENHNRHTEHCTGDYLTQCKNCHDCFEAIGGEDSKFCEYTKPCKDVYDSSGNAINAELLYEVLATGRGQRMRFCFRCDTSSDLLYCVFCFNSHDLFGCVGLRNKQYCIFNRQYSKAEYEALVPRLIGHMQATQEWGEYFPPTLSPFSYNETMAFEAFPLTKKEVLAKGWRWREETNEIPKVEKIIPARLLPDRIEDIPDDILNWAIECEETKKPFIIQKPELEFYRKMGLPIPHYHPDVRHAKRMAKRNPRKLWGRTCDHCGKGIQTTYAPDRPEKVFCEHCYTEAVY